jgi:uncharacterized protein
MLTLKILKSDLLNLQTKFLSTSSRLISSLIIVTVSAALIGCSSAPSLPLLTSKDPKSAASNRRALSKDATPLDRLIFGTVEQTTYTFIYDPAYVKLDYPMGDVPLERGVCADVVVRAFRKAGIDLQKEVHEDMTKNFSAYPNRWGARRPDKNIDHRRVANLMTYFERKGRSLSLSKDPKEYLPGDIVAWNLNKDGSLLHIGMISDEKSEDSSNYLVVHNIGSGAKFEDVLFAWEIIGHYRYFNSTQPKEGKR